MAYKPRVLTVSEGGTGISSATAYAVICGGTTSTGALQSIASVGTSGQVLTSNGAGALPTFQNAPTGLGSNSEVNIFSELLTYAPDSSGIATFYDTKLTTGVTVLGSSSSYSGTGTAAHPGICVLDTGTTSSDYACLFNNPSCYLFGGGTYTFEANIQIPTLSTGTQRFTLYIGFGNYDLLGSEFTNGAYFVYSDNLNSGQWQIKTASNGTRTTGNTASAPSAATWYRLKVIVNAAGTSVSYYINDSEVSGSPLSTNIPTATGRETGVACLIKKSVGSTARTLLIDYVYQNVLLTTAR